LTENENLIRPAVEETRPDRPNRYSFLEATLKTIYLRKFMKGKNSRKPHCVCLFRGL